MLSNWCSVLIGFSRTKIRIEYFKVEIVKFKTQSYMDKFSSVIYFNSNRNFHVPRREENQTNKKRCIENCKLFGTKVI